MDTLRLRARGAVAAFAIASATAAAVLIGSPAHAAATGTVVRQPSAPGQLAYALRVTVTYDTNAPTTEWRIEFDLPSTGGVLPSAEIGFTRSGDHWVGRYRSALPMVAGDRLTVGFIVYGTADPTNCVIDGTPCTYSALTDTTPPTTPANVVATRITYPGVGTAVFLGWSPSTDDFGVAGYEVSVNGVVVRTTTTTSQFLPSPATTTTYAVRAFDRVGNYSTSGTFTLPPP
jgi:hypothetical protein